MKVWEGFCTHSTVRYYWTLRGCIQKNKRLTFVENLSNEVLDDLKLPNPRSFDSLLRDGEEFSPSGSSAPRF